MDTNNETSFDPTPKLKPSPELILFIPFNYDENKCNHCESKYSVTLLYQKYCKNCFFRYIKNPTSGNNTYLDVHISTNNTRCIEHEATRNADFRTSNIQEWCQYCSEVSYFNQIVTPFSFPNKHVEKKKKIESDCKLCEKLIYQPDNYDEFKLCSGCYLISSGWVESALTGFKNDIPILYLPWWDTKIKCIVCNQALKDLSDSQKWCLYCFIIYTGCRYCLTTNIIFGITDKSHCRKCKRILSITIDIANLISGNYDIDNFLYGTRFNTNNYHIIANYTYNSNESPLDIYKFIKREKFVNNIQPIMEWIPYSQIKNLEKIAEGGYGIVYKATWLDDRISHTYKNQTVAVKRFIRDIKTFLNELKSLFQCYDNKFIIKYYGITQDPESKEYMLILEYANGGNLHKYLQTNFKSITWNDKIKILCKISSGLSVIHEKNFIHRDFHSGNILLSELTESSYQHWKIGDLGLSQSANNISLINEIYGVMPYIAPEILKVLLKGAIFSKESDIYSMGMIMWEITTGCKPFANVEHSIDLIYKIIDGKRPEITSDTPECFTNLMKKCWDSNPAKRPSAKEIYETVYYWLYRERNVEQFNKAEKTRLELIELKKLVPEFTKKSHPAAIYTSRPLHTSSNNSFSTSLLTSTKQEYNTRECDFDLDDIDIDNNQIVDNIDNIDDYHNKPTIKWIPYSQISEVLETEKGLFAIWSDGTKDEVVAVKRLKTYNSEMSETLFNKLKSIYQCYDIFDIIVKCYGITKDPETKENMLVMEYADGGDLHNYLQNNFTNITWMNKLTILQKISEGLHAIHKENFVHQDFHSGNILLSESNSYQHWKIGDLGLSQLTNSNEIYGVIPYIAPEIFKGSAFSKESDIYSMGMIMWELTTGCKPFADVGHDDHILILEIIDGKQPNITNDTPECFANLMRRCLDSNSAKRPSIEEILETFYDWLSKKDVEQFIQAEKTRLNLIELKKFDSEFTITNKYYFNTIYTGRLLGWIFNSSFINSSSLQRFGFYLSISLNHQIAVDMNNIDDYSDNHNAPIIKWIPYLQIKNIYEIAKGGFSIVYKATWLGNIVAMKRYPNSQNSSKYLLNELNSHYQCYSIDVIIKHYGITKDPESKDYMLVMEYADGGDLHNYLQNNFTDITLTNKLTILQKISEGLHAIHKKNFLHRDIHSGNILLSESNSYQHWKIGDFGLSTSANNNSNNEIYGVVPYIAPEIFKESAFSKESDIYSMGMIMWELTTGCKPFAYVEHDVGLVLEIIDGKRPEITDDTPECFANLMKRCWDSDPIKRPTTEEILETFYDWSRKDAEQSFIQAEEKRLELIKLKKLGPEFTEKSHTKASFTSRPFRSLISKSSSINSLHRDYKSVELDIDIDIDIQSWHSGRKHDIEELEIETQSNGKRIKTDDGTNSEFQD